MKRRRTIVYQVKETKNKLDAIPLLSVIKDLDIPDEKHLRSQYFHSIMVALENLTISFEVYNIGYLSEILKKIEDYSKKERANTSRRHRILLWKIECRINWLLAENDEIYFSIKDSYLKQQELIMSNVHPSEMDIFTLWRSINIIIDKLNRLRYHDSLYSYVRCVFLRCANLTWFCGTDKKIFNHVVFVRRLTNGEMCINETFLIETERIFKDIWDHFERWKLFSPVEVMDDFPRENNEIFVGWMRGIHSGIFRDFIEREYRECVYGAYVYVSERDRYLDEERDFSNPTAYSIVAKYRPSQIDEISKLLSSPTFIDDIIENHEAWKDPQKIDISYDLLCRTLIRYYFDSVIGSLENMDEYILSSHEGGTPDYIKEISMQYPRIVQLFHEYGLIYKGSSVTFSNLGFCFMAWVKVMCEEPSINGILPTSKSNICPLYDIFYPDTPHLVKRQVQEVKLILDMPDVYDSKKDEDNNSFF